MTVCFRMFLPFVRAQWEILIRYLQKGVQMEWKKRERNMKKKSTKVKKHRLPVIFLYSVYSFFVVRIYKMKLIYVETWHEEAPLHTNLIFLMDSHDYISVYTSTKQKSYIHLFLYILQTFLFLIHVKALKNFFLSWKDTFWYRSFQ